MKNQITNSKSKIIRLAAACLLLAAFGPPAAELSRASDGRGGPPVPLELTGVDTICGFPVQSTVSGMEGVIFLPGGDLLVTAPTTFNTFTNLQDPSKSVTLNITGPAIVEPVQNGQITIHGLGRGVVFGPSFGIHLLIGEWTFVIDANTGLLLEAPTGNGQMIDICELIQ
jgi:hypothetical protein